MFRIRSRGKPIYVVCMSSRSGSTYFTDLVRQTGALGFPNEYGNVQAWAAKIGVRSTDMDRKYVRALLNERAGENGVFGTKFTPTAYEKFVKYVVPTHHIFLTRQDIARQAISLYRGEATGQLIRLTDEARAKAIARGVDPSTDWITSEAPSKEIPFDREAILKCRRRIEATNKAWEDIFQRHRIEPLRITYERLCEDHRAVLHQVADYLGVPLNSVPEASNTRIMRDDLTEEWIRRLEEADAPGVS